MALVDELTIIQDNLVSELRTETAYRAAKGAKPTYSANGRTVQWSEYLKTMLESIAAVNQQILQEQNQNDPYEFQVHNYL